MIETAESVPEESVDEDRAKSLLLSAALRRRSKKQQPQPQASESEPDGIKGTSNTHLTSVDFPFPILVFTELIHSTLSVMGMTSSDYAYICVFGLYIYVCFFHLTKAPRFLQII